MNVAIYTRVSSYACKSAEHQLSAIRARIKEMELPWKIVAVFHESGSHLHGIDRVSSAEPCISEPRVSDAGFRLQIPD